MNLARQGKVPLVEMAGYRGTWDEIHGDRFNQDVRTVAEDLIEYMHANPVQEPSQQDAFTSDDLTEEEGAVLRGSTQDLTGFGNPGTTAKRKERNVQCSPDRGICTLTIVLYWYMNRVR